MSTPKIRSAIAFTAAILAAMAIPTPYARASALPMTGTSKYNAPMCGTNDFERIKTLVTEYAAVDSAGSCVSSERLVPAFTITSVTRNLQYQMPGISSGFMPTGEPTCASARDTCFLYPVRQEDDGTPVATFGAWLAPGNYSLAFDTWFSPVKSRHSYDDRAGDTEVMIWLSEPGGSWPGRFRYYVKIDQMTFGVMAWYQPKNKVNYVAYVNQTGPGSQRSDTATKGQGVAYRKLWLNPFWRDAIAHGWMNPKEWLWQIFLGYELRTAVPAGNGAGSTISGYSLSDVA